MARRSKIQREKDFLEIERRYLRGESQSSIAANIGVSQQSVSNDIKKIIERWRLETTLDIDDLKTQELTKINNLEMTYWKAWYAAEEPPGNPSFLTGVLACINKRCQILGIDAPMKSEMKAEVITKVSDAEYNRAISSLASAAANREGVHGEGAKSDGTMDAAE